MVTMDSNGESPYNESEFHLYCEAANRLHVLYIFEGEPDFTESFIETINLIYRRDDLWEEYNRYINSPVEPDVHPIWNESLWKMAAAFIAIHLSRLSIPSVPEDFQSSIAAIYQLFHHNLETTLKTIIRVRDVDYDFMSMLGIIMPDSSGARA